MFDFLRKNQSKPRQSPAAEGAPVGGFELRWARWTMSSKTRMRIYEKLGKFVGNGVSMPQALAELHVHETRDGKKPKSSAAIAINEWRRAVLNGQSFSRALQGWAPMNELSLLAAGEVSGRFDRAVEDLLFVHHAGKRIRSAIGGLMYPVFLLSTTVLYLYIFGAQVVPAFSSVLPKERWTGAGHTMALMADFVNHGLLPTVLVFVCLLVAIISTFGVWTGKVRQFLDHLPPWSIYRLVVGAGFLISLSALLHAGISMPDALRLIAQNAAPWYRERLIAARMQVLNGARNIGDALAKTGLQFPSEEIVIDIRSYASLDGFEEMLDKLSHQWLEDAVRLINAQMDLLRTITILIMGFVFMWIASGMFDLQQQISRAASSGG